MKTKRSSVEQIVEVLKQAEVVPVANFASIASGPRNASNAKGCAFATEAVSARLLTDAGPSGSYADWTESRSPGAPNVRHA